MIPVKRNITIRIGDVHEIFFRIRQKVWDGTAWVPGPYQDLTGWEILIQVRQTTETEVLLTYTTTFGDQEDVVSGRGAVYAKLLATQTETVDRTITKGGYDIQVTDDIGDPRTFVEGDVVFTKDWSRDE